MNKPLQTPDFKSEEEEALWWEQNQDLVLVQFEQAAKDGALGRHRQESPVSSLQAKSGLVQPASIVRRLKQTA